jgi:hypothetical protein
LDLATVLDTDPATQADEALLDRFQRGAFEYFLRWSNAENGLVADTSRDKSPCSIAVVGFALSCYPIGVERGWMSRGVAAERTLRTLDFFWNGLQSPEPDATGYKGFYYHFIDMDRGRRIWNCELSLVDTALLLAGVVVAATYFDRDDAAEAAIRARAEALCRRADWQWAMGGDSTLRQGWKPESGFLHYGWEGYNEATILYVLALASQDHPVSEDGYPAWTKTYQWENIYGYDMLYGGPLFMHQYSHAWIDFAGIRDEFMREKNSDYFENSRRATLVHREYARRNPYSFAGYGKDFWGLTANDGPGGPALEIGGLKRRFFGYAARGAPFGPDDGTVAPWASLASLPFAPQEAIAALRHFCALYPNSVNENMLPSSVNPTLAGQAGYGPKGWISEGYYGLDQGLVVMMIENYRSGLVWELTRRSHYVRKGLERAGFRGGWLTRSTFGS